MHNLPNNHHQQTVVSVPLDGEASGIVKSGINFIIRKLFLTMLISITKLIKTLIHQHFTTKKCLLETNRKIWKRWFLSETDAVSMENIEDSLEKTCTLSSNQEGKYMYHYTSLPAILKIFSIFQAKNIV